MFFSKQIASITSQFQFFFDCVRNLLEVNHNRTTRDLNNIEVRLKHIEELLTKK